MKRVTGIGGIFFKSKNPQQTQEWYQQHLGIKSEAWGATLKWRDFDDPTRIGTTAWSPMKADTPYFAPSTSEFMVNYRVDDLEALLMALKAEGVEQLGEMQAFDYGKFAWILDPDGNKIELWEPIDAPVEEGEKGAEAAGQV